VPCGIEIDLIEIRWKARHGIYLALDRDLRWALLNTTMNILVA
jgi:hypothetical protein